MSRLITAPAVDAAPSASQPLLAVVQKKLGSVPNMFRAIASTPAGLEGYLGLEGALGKDSLVPEGGLIGASRGGSLPPSPANRIRSRHDDARQTIQ